VCLRHPRPLPSAMSQGPRALERRRLAASSRAQPPPGARRQSGQYPSRNRARLEEWDATTSWQHDHGMPWNDTRQRLLRPRHICSRVPVGRQKQGYGRGYSHGVKVVYDEPVRFEGEAALACMRCDPLEGRRRDVVDRAGTLSHGITACTCSCYCSTAPSSSSSSSPSPAALVPGPGL
jgi:hypothetical protein